MFKILLALCSVLFAPALASAAEQCSTQLVYRDGQFRDFVRVDCDNYPGTCLQELRDARTGEYEWKAVDEKVCDEAARKK